jgi:hypothetical protein
MPTLCRQYALIRGGRKIRCPLCPSCP